MNQSTTHRSWNLPHDDGPESLGANAQAAENKDPGEGVHDLEYWVEIRQLFSREVDVGHRCKGPSHGVEKDEDEEAGGHGNDVFTHGLLPHGGGSNVAQGEENHDDGEL